MENKVYFRLFYGINLLNPDGREHTPFDAATDGNFYESIDEAIKQAELWFDGQCNELRSHSASRREDERAFCRIDAVTNVSDENPDGDDAWDLLDEETKTILIESDFVLDGAFVNWQENRR
jgi:hypothetical protein